MSEQSKKGLTLKEVEVKRGSKTFKRKQWVKNSKDNPKSKKELPKDKGSFKIGDSINFMGKDSKIEKVNEKEQTVKINGKVYTFDIIKKGNKIKKSETVDSIFKNRKLEINKSELSKAVNVETESGEPGFAFIPQVYDNKKLEDKVVSESSLWMKKIQKDLEKDLKNFYNKI